MTPQQGEALNGAASDQPAKYFIDAEMAEARRRSLAVMVASRQCYMCQQSTEEELDSTEAQDLVAQIVDHCASANDYLLEDTPLKEAIFRVLLSRGNQPMGASEISVAISEKWGNATNQRNTSPAIIERLLRHGESYCISPYREDEDD
jgi:hypothetical protein